MMKLRSTLRLTALAAVTVAAGVACRDDPVAPRPPENAPAASGARSVVISPEVTALDLGVHAIAYGINDAGFVVGQSGELAARWSPTGELRLIRASCPVCPVCDPFCTPSWPNDAPSAALDINNFGSVVGYYTYHERPTYAPIRGGFLWSESAGFANIGWLDYAGRTANPQGTTAYAINDAGAIVGESPRAPGPFTFPFEHAFLRSPAGVMQDLTPFIGDWSRAYGIAANGDAVGFSFLDAGTLVGEQPMLWHPGGGMVGLGTFGGPSGRAVAINGAGVVVGTATDASLVRAAFRWTSATGIQRLEGVSTPYAINDERYVAGEQAQMSNPPYYRRAVVVTPQGRVIELGTLGGANSVAYAINASSQVAGMSEDAAGQQHAVRWDIHFDTNAPPIANAGGPYRGVEGSPIAFDGTVSDPAGQTLVSSWNFGDGASAAGVDVSHAYADDGSYVATLTTTDPGGLSASGTATVFVGNLPPSLQLDAPAPIASGESFRLRATFSDPGVNDAPWRYQATWSTGTPTSGSTSDQSAPILLDSPRYCAPGSYDVWLTITDKDDGVRNAMIRLAVNAVPVATQIGPAAINPKSNGTMTVAILSSSSFDARLIDPSTITLGNAVEGMVSVARHPDWSVFASLQDVNGDGLLDRVAHFDRRAVAAAGLFSAPSAQLTVRARLSDACRSVLGTAMTRVVASDR